MAEFRPSSQPYDRALALACRLSTFRPFWLECVCPCQIKGVPVRMLCQDAATARMTLADVVVRMRCENCGTPPTRISLREFALMSPGSNPPNGWIVPLIGEI
jgi:hypothetical protein